MSDQASDVTAEVTDTPITKKTLDGKRKSTDVLFKYLFCIVFSAWIGIIVYVNCFERNYEVDIVKFFNKTEDKKFKDRNNVNTNSNSKNNNKDDSKYGWLTTIEKVIDYAINIVEIGFEQSGALLSWYIIFGIFVYLVFLMFLRFLPKFFTFIGILSLLTMSSLSVLNLIVNAKKIYNLQDDAVIVTPRLLADLLQLLFVVFILGCILKTKIRPIAEVIGKSLRAMFFFRSLILFVFFIIIMVAFVYTVTVPTIELTQPNDPLRYVILLGSFYIYNFICSFGNMVISETVAAWHWPSANKQDTSGATILDCIARVSRYHLGSIAFSATYVLPICQAKFNVLKYRFRAPEKKRNFFVEFIFTIYLIINISNYAEILVAIKGYNYNKAVKKSFEILIKNYYLSLVLVEICYAAVMFGLAITYSVTYFLPLLFLGMNNLPEIDDTDSVMVLLTLSTIGLTFFMNLINVLQFPVMLPVLSSVRTTLICNLEDEEDETESSEDNNYNICQPVV